LNVSKSWNFTIKSDTTTTSDTYTIFGYEIAKNIALIVIVGTITVILAILVPFIIFAVWRNDDKNEVNENDRLTSFVPNDESKYVQTEDSTQVRRKVDNIEPKPQEKDSDVWDMYSAPKPVVSEEQKQEDLSAIEESEIQQQEPIQQSQEIVVPATPEPATTEPTIPEPEIPDTGDLEKIFQQIQEERKDN
jgi:hypothetical protein